MPVNYISEIGMFAFGMQPLGWAFCDGSSINKSQLQGLYAMIGNLYGGTQAGPEFSLPDLRGRTPIGCSADPLEEGRRAVPLGQSGGASAVTLTNSNINWSHSHTWNASPSNGNSSTAESMLLANVVSQTSGSTSNFSVYIPQGSAPNSFLALGTISTKGGEAHNNMQPSLAINYCICTLGIGPW